VKSINNNRRVLAGLKKFTDASNETYFLGFESLFGGNVMDGRVRVFTLENLLNSENAKQLVDTHFVETSYGVLSGDYFNLNAHEYLVIG